MLRVSVIVLLIVSFENVYWVIPYGDQITSQTEKTLYNYRKSYQEKAQF